MRPAVAALLLLAGCSVAFAEGPSWYTCDPAACLAPECACASVSAPMHNGAPLAPEDTPQFIVITHDDAITPTTNMAIRSVIDKHTNRNGCNVPATFFVLTILTECELARAFWEENSELAIHSSTHVQLVDPFDGDLEAEMMGARDFLNQTCGIPLEDMVGFRTPLLAHNPPVRQVLFDAGFLYDSSIPEFWPSPTSPNATNRAWPYTMDAGIPQDCTYFGSANCTQDERYPGMWEIPLLETQDAVGELLYSMDPGLDTQAGYGSDVSGGMKPKDLEALLKQNFDNSYYGNRAPFGLYTHTPWFTDDNILAANAFLEYALGLNDTWVVTYRQLIEWMQNPVPASQMDEWLTCKPVDLENAPGMKKCQVHKVADGDTGSDIAAQYGVELSALEGLNPSVDVDSLQIGDLLLIPPFDDSCPDP